MCGRITQARGRAAYAEEIGWEPDLRETRLPGPWGPDRNPHYNMPPGLYPDVMHTLAEGRPHFDTIHWGYQPPWAKERGLPMTINPRIEGAATKPYFRHMFRQGRIIVPADGWYEWTGEKGHKQPWYIRRRDGGALFLAAITNFRPYTEQDKQVGFTIITTAADGGLVDVHDRRPVVFDAEDARIWMENSQSSDQAEQLARSRSLPPDTFEWYRVSTDVNSARNNQPHLIEPLTQN